MIFETHAHYDLPQFDRDRDELIAGLRAAGIGPIVVPAIGFDSNQQMMRVMEPYDDVWFSVGIHPSRTPVDSTLDEEMDAALRQLAAHPRVVAIGELGLDYHNGLGAQPDLIQRQREWFRRQLAIARDTNLPLVLHLRSDNERPEQALWDGLHIIGESGHEYRGIVHCFHDSYQTAKGFLDAGEYYFGIGGVLAFEHQEVFRDAVARLPLETLVLETDAPFLHPMGRRERNTSLILPDVVKLIAELKGCTTEKVEEVTTENAQRLFGL